MRFYFLLVILFSYSSYGQIILNNRNWVNVKEYGAKGDGKTNDQVAVQKALAQVRLNGTLYFPAGIYRATLSIRRNDIKIEGAGSGKTILKTPDSVNANVIEIGNTADPYARNFSIFFKNVHLSGITLNGNSGKVPEPATDLTAWGLAVTATSNSTFKDIRVINCWNGGVGFFILSNNNVGNFYVESCGFAGIYANEPGFDINSSSYNNFEVVVKNCAYGARILDNCIKNVLKATIINAMHTGFMIGDQLVNTGSHHNRVNATIKGGCKDQAVSVGAKASKNIFTFNILGVKGHGIHELDSTYFSNNMAMAATGNEYKILSKRNGGSAASIGGSFGKWSIKSFSDGRRDKKGDHFAIRIKGSKNEIEATVFDEAQPKVRGLIFEKKSNANKLLSYNYNTLVQILADQGTNNIYPK